MHENNADGNGAIGDDHLHSRLGFENTVQHLSVGYENCQSAVRFLDTKAAAVVGGVPVIIGIFTAVFRWAFDADIDDLLTNCTTSKVVAVFTAIAILLLAWFSLYAAFQALTPRDTGSEKPSVLFPYKAPDFEQRLADFTNGAANKAAVLEDYRRQLTRMSTIVEAKLGHVKQSIKYLQYLLGAGLIAVGVLVLVVAFSLPPAGPS